MKIVIFRILCVTSILVVIAITHVVLQTLGEKGIKIFNNRMMRWCLSFGVGVLLFLLGVKLILT